MSDIKWPHGGHQREARPDVMLYDHSYSNIKDVVDAQFRKESEEPAEAREQSRRLLWEELSALSEMKNPSPLDNAQAKIHPVKVLDYKVQAGDQLDSKFFFNSELHELSWESFLARYQLLAMSFSLSVPRRQFLLLKKQNDSLGFRTSQQILEKKENPNELSLEACVKDYVS